MPFSLSKSLNNSCILKSNFAYAEEDKESEENSEEQSKQKEQEESEEETKDEKNKENENHEQTTENTQIPSGNNPVNIDSLDKITSYYDAKIKLAEVDGEYKTLMDAALKRYEEIDKITAQAFEVQEKMVEKQQQIWDIAKREYIEQTTLNLFYLILSSQSLGDFIKSVDYTYSVFSYQFSLYEELDARKKEFNKLIDQLNEQNEAQLKDLNTAAEKIANAQTMVDNAASLLTPSELAELHALLDSMGINVTGPNSVPDINSANWNAGLASAYGGCSDPTTPNPGRTATGDICNDSTMGVAVPMAWPNYRQFFHHTVLIRHNGLTIIAKINDCGGMNGGERSLDLQPGVFKSFGAQTCQAWGVRFVEYKII